MAAIVTDAGLQRIIQLIQADLTHIALGNVAGTITTSSTQLDGEFFRLALTENFVDGQTIVAEIYLDETQANDMIRQVGLFANGTSEANSGTLVVVEDVNITKTNTESMTVSVELTVNRR